MNKYARLSLIAAAAMTLAACGKQEQPAAGAASAPAAAAGGDVTVKIGQVSPMSGPISHLGKDNEFGAKLAIEDLNAEGVEIGGKKVKFELVSEMTRAIRKSVPRLPSAW
jgi:branched-chain amino acid transport system substrate-binding protein